MAGQDRSVRNTAPLMNPCVSESPIVTSRCFAFLGLPAVTGMPSVGSVTGCLGSYRISTSAGIACLSVITPPPGAPEAGQDD